MSTRNLDWIMCKRLWFLLSYGMSCIKKGKVTVCQIRIMRQRATRREGKIGFEDTIMHLPKTCVKSVVTVMA